MKELELTTLGLEEMNQNQLQEVDGGWGWYYELCAFLVDNAGALLDASGEVIRGGGTTCTNGVGSK